MHSVRPAALLLPLPLLLAACGQEPDGIAIGDAWIPGEAIDTAVLQMKGSFPQWGEDSLSWHILSGGFGPGMILHQRLAVESAGARQEAEAWAERLRAGESFADLARERSLQPDQDPVEDARAPSPFELGSGRVAAAVGGLLPGEWAGPIQTIRGWELIYLHERHEGHRNRASVSLIRLEFPVGGEADRQQATEAWNTLPIGGSADRVRRLPYSFRHGREAAASSS